MGWPGLIDIDPIDAIPLPNKRIYQAGTGESHLSERMRQPKAARPEDGQKSGIPASEYALVGGGPFASRAGMWCHQSCEDALDEPMQRRPAYTPVPLQSPLTPGPQSAPLDP
jgi:hypothetical protein